MSAALRIRNLRTDEPFILLHKTAQRRAAQCSGCAAFSKKHFPSSSAKLAKYVKNSNARKDLANYFLCIARKSPKDGL